MSPSTNGSSTPVIVTVCGTFQSASVNTTLAGETVPSVVSLLASANDTSATGWLRSASVNVAVAPDSLVTSPAVGVTTTPAVSSSSFVSATSAASSPAYPASALAAAPVWM